MNDRLVDLDDLRSWPTAVREWAQAQADALRGTTAITSDLTYQLIERDDEFRTLLTGTKLIVYHCTRLLEWEAEDIRQRGLRPLTRELVEQRIDEAKARGALTRPQADLLRRSHTFALSEQDGREGQVCFVAGREGFDDDGLHYLLSLWGGEGIYWAHADDPDPPTIGVASIVVAGIDVSDHSRRLSFFPALGKLFVGKLLDIERTYADVLLHGPVPPTDIIDIWQPGHSEYDRLKRLPLA